MRHNLGLPPLDFRAPLAGVSPTDRWSRHFACAAWGARTPHRSWLGPVTAAAKDALRSEHGLRLSAAARIGVRQISASSSRDLLAISLRRNPGDAQV